MTESVPGQAQGVFISFEGVEAVGKSTAMRVAGEILTTLGVDWISTREPGGTPVAEQLRAIVLGTHEEAVSDTTELLLMFAARAQSIANVIRPALAMGQWVLCDRFTDATLAYQGYGRGFELDVIYRLAALVHDDLWPDKTLLLHAEPAVVAERLASRPDGKDRIEQQSSAFFESVRRGYETLAAASPDRYVRLDTSGSVTTLEANLRDLFSRWLSSNKKHQ
ncbi:MAG: dTMP kinase [Pseudomonadota bacterium]